MAQTGHVTDHESAIGWNVRGKNYAFSGPQQGHAAAQFVLKTHIIRHELARRLVKFFARLLTTPHPSYINAASA
jgi:hypothetical protein